jgi:hypothetical protein
MIYNMFQSQVIDIQVFSVEFTGVPSSYGTRLFFRRGICLVGGRLAMAGEGSDCGTVPVNKS